MFLKIDGIPGEATAQDHKDWIEVGSMSYRIPGLPPPSALRAHPPTATQGSAHKGSITILKTYDKSSPKLYEACCQGRHLGEMTLSWSWGEANVGAAAAGMAGAGMPAAGGGGGGVLLQYKLTDVIVSSIVVYGPNLGPRKPNDGITRDVPLESITLNFAEVEWSWGASQPGAGGGAAME
jgi:type VI secretion system secreted protein Hcp